MLWQSNSGSLSGKAEGFPVGLKIKRVDPWAASIKDKPGTLAAKLKARAGAGANLEFVIAGRTPEKRGAGVVFVTPINGPKRIRAVKRPVSKKTGSLHTVRIEGADRRGSGAKIAQALADTGLNLRGLSAAAINEKFAARITLDISVDAGKAVRVLQKL
ncbi:MAG TPA: amino acid-binding protein [Verrucomicrobiae bacterium]|nr:amino acid-binding protein [Verrucomicrobiae bacterium]